MFRIDVGKKFIQRINWFESQTKGLSKLLVDFFFPESTIIASINEGLSWHMGGFGGPLAVGIINSLGRSTAFITFWWRSSTLCQNRRQAVIDKMFMWQLHSPYKYTSDELENELSVWNSGAYFKRPTLRKGYFPPLISATKRIVT